MSSSTISAFQKVLPTFKFSEPVSFPELFAIKRYKKKMEVPDSKTSSERRQRCWSDWIGFDESLQLPALLPGNWYKARLLIHDLCTSFRLDPVVFTNGSEATSTHGYNSLESKLMRSKWECTPECFDLWAETAYSCLAIRRAVRARFSSLMRHDAFAVRGFHQESWARFHSDKRGSFLCFKRTLSHLTTIRESSRFSTVRKNNAVDRPIDVQPLCNMLVQRRVGNGFRSLLRERCGVDLDTRADLHRRLVSNPGLATIDLKNASDSITIDLVRFLFPKHVLSYILAARTPYTEGPDRQYYMTKKISAMGNGFTFELMCTIFLALGLQHSPSFTVFGDDMILPNEHARPLIEDLEAACFVVNRDKSFVDSPFRESCGANYHDEFGYIESYDFEYPVTIHDCAVIHNKLFLLRHRYPAFKRLYHVLHRAVPLALRGPAPAKAGDGRQGSYRRLDFDGDIDLSTLFWAEPREVKGESWVDSHVARVLKAYGYEPSSFSKVVGHVYRPKEASRCVRSLHMKRHTGKYFMYLQAGGLIVDGIDDEGSWQQAAFLTDGRNLFRFKTLCGVKLQAA